MPFVDIQHKAHRWVMALRPSAPFDVTGQGSPSDGFSIPDRDFFLKAMPAKFRLV
jgi:hypothetical protein